MFGLFEEAWWRTPVNINGLERYRCDGQALVAIILDKLHMSTRPQIREPSELPGFPMRVSSVWVADRSGDELCSPLLPDSG